MLKSAWVIMQSVQDDAKWKTDLLEARPWNQNMAFFASRDPTISYAMCLPPGSLMRSAVTFQSGSSRSRYALY